MEEEHTIQAVCRSIKSSNNSEHLKETVRGYILTAEC